MIGYLLDTGFGPYTQPTPSAAVTRARLDTLYDEAVLVDLLGFDAILVPDRHARSECAVGSPLVFLSSLSRVITHARLGVYSLVLSAYHPMLIAEEAALLDNLATRRPILGVSMGFDPRYWAQYGIDGQTKVSRFEEGIEILQRAWTRDSFSFHGKRFDLDDVRCRPVPASDDGPELWIGGESRQSLVRAAKVDGWAAGLAPINVPSWKRRVEDYRMQAAGNGRRSHVAILRDAFVAETYEEAASAVGDAFVEEQRYDFRGHGGKPLHPDFTHESDYTIDALRDHSVIGTPQDCIDSITRLQTDLDVDSVVLRFRMAAGPPREQVRDSLMLFGEQVLPVVQRSTASR